MKAIDAYTKAIEDNGGIFPKASYNLGLSYNNIGKISENENDYLKAIDAYLKAIKDSDNHYPLAHYALSKVYLERNIILSRQHALIALQQDDEDLRILYHVLDYFSNEHTQPIYQEKVQYLEFYTYSTWQNMYAVNEETLKLKLKKKKGIVKNTSEEYKLMEYCLLHDSPLFNDAKTNKHRFLYLYFIHRKKYAEAFYVLDDLMDFQQCQPVDEYFRLHLTNLVGGV